MKLLRAMGMSAVAVVVAIFTMGGSLEPTTADAQTGAITCGSVVRGDVDGNGVGDLLVRAWDPQAGTDFELVRYPTQDRQVIGATALDARVEPSVTLDAAALGDLDGDGCAEAVFGGQLWPTASDQWYGTQSRLYVVPGSPTGLHLDRAVRIDLDGDAINQIVVVPGTHQIAATTRRNTGGEARGTLHVLTLNSQFASVIHRVVRGQDLKVQGAEQFGYALAADGNTIAVGSPDELIDRTGVRGAVYLYSASTLRYTRIHQRSKGVYTRWLSRFGHSVDLLDGRLVIGAPNADVGNHNGAGRVYLLRWNETKRTYSVVRSFSQATKGVPGAARDNDALGSTVVIARGLTASSSYDVVAAAMYDQLDNVKNSSLPHRHELRQRRLPIDHTGLTWSAVHPQEARDVRLDTGGTQRRPPNQRRPGFRFSTRPPRH